MKTTSYLWRRWSGKCNTILHIELLYSTRAEKEILDKILLERFRFENSSRIDGVGPGPVISSPLSTAALRLLKEYGLRYGVVSKKSSAYVYCCTVLIMDNVGVF